MRRASILCPCAAIAFALAGQLSIPARAQNTPPLDAQARVVPGGVEILYNSSWQAAAQISRSPGWAPGQGFRKFFFFSDSTAPQQPPGGGVDQFVASGSTYRYSITGTPFVQSFTITYRPACTSTGQCPAAAGTPPSYKISCRMPADFFTAGTQSAPAATGQTAFSGFGTVFPSSSVTLACLPGTVNSLSTDGSCDGFSQTVSVVGCNPPPAPTPKPIKTCQPCIDSGRVCVKSGSGFVCKGLPK